MEELSIFFFYASVSYVLMKALSLFVRTHEDNYSSFLISIAIMVLFVISLPISLPMYFISKKNEKIDEEDRKFSLLVEASNVRSDERKKNFKDIEQIKENSYADGYFKCSENESLKRDEILIADIRAAITEAIWILNTTFLQMTLSLNTMNKGGCHA